MLNKKVAVLGAGMVGKTIALDLRKDFDVCVFDISQSNLDQIKKRDFTIQVQQIDLLNNLDNFSETFRTFDILVLAVPGFMGFRCLKAAIQCGKPIADISFFPEDALALNDLAKMHGVPVIVDCGVAPGMSNLILGKYDSEMQVKSFECYVGGLPKERNAPWEYKAPFSPIDVIEEYTRPARMIENGKIVTKEALTDREFLHFDGIGTLEAFNTDGLRSLLHYFADVPNMKEKTLRYPGYLDKILSLKQMGFFSDQKIDINGSQVSPLDMTAKILTDKWKLGEEESEFTVMRVIIKGIKDENPVEVTYDLFDEYDKQTKTSSMARTTGYTCTAMVKILANGWSPEAGIFPPEVIGMDPNLFKFVLDHLRDRGVNWKYSI